MFSFLFGKKKTAKFNRLSDKTWVNQDQKYNGLVQELSTQTEMHFVVAFFKRTIPYVQTKFEQRGQKYHLLESNGQPHFPEHATAIVLTADQLENKNLLSLIDRSKVPVRMHFVEHYPKLPIEKSVLEVLKNSEMKITIQFYNSLDEPLFQKFGGDNIISLMQRMGMQDNEYISHSMVDKAILNMQKKLDASVPNEIRSSSIEEWLSVNTSAG